jgi:hypothetical protein
VTRIIRVLGVLCGAARPILAAPGSETPGEAPSLIREDAAEGALACKLTEPAEVIALLGKPQGENEREL